jgi:hypothetical protein
MSVIHIRSFPLAKVARTIVAERCAEFGTSAEERQRRIGAAMRAIASGRSSGEAIKAGSEGLFTYTAQGGAA